MLTYKDSPPLLILLSLSNMDVWFEMYTSEFFFLIFGNIDIKIVVFESN